MGRKALRVTLAGWACAIFATSAAGTPTFTVVFDDPAHLLAPWQPQLTAAAIAGAEVWGREVGSNASIDIVIIANTSIPRATGRSSVAAFNRVEGSLIISDQGVGHEFRTGVDANGSAPDIEININPAYVAAEFWFDADPLRRSAPVPNDRLDAISVFSHEIGHAVCYNGYINDFDGTYFDQFRSTFDYLTLFDGDEFSYIGAAGTGVYGGPVPLTYGNTDHWGNLSPRPGEDLVGEMMNGIVYQFGRRYFASSLDRAVLIDTEIPVACLADFNRSGGASVQDIFDFLEAYFGGLWIADINRSGAVSVQDIFDYLAEYFAGCL